MERELQITADGSHTLSIPSMEVTYHSKHGAIQESNHVFIDAGLKYYTGLHPDQTIQILEIGFGTGLNCLLTAIYAREQKLSIQYHGIDAFPLLTEEARSLNHGQLLNNNDLFQQLHACSWNQLHTVDTCFQLHKHHTSLELFSANGLFDCVYYDAFAPSAQPELWTSTIFSQLFSMLGPGGILVTYCSKSDVRRAMQAAGFRVTKIQGPHGKREMVRAFKDA
ncbi:MAG TPA: SAM-dependent methyltransferase [Chitinophagaceae bacterium]|nr:SAM-dependent methyltransferase [Chitinophagaceae bacterium]